MWKPIKCYQSHSECYKNTKTMTVRGVLWHSTGANNPNICRYVQPWETEADYDKMIELIGYNKRGNDYNHKVGWQQGMNAVIGRLAAGDVATVQTMPWNYRPWGCASGKHGSCNNGWVQFEWCEDSLNDKEYFEAGFEQACQLTAFICYTYNLDPFGTVEYNGKKVPVITCHAEANSLGFASNHRDVLHWFKKHDKTMDDVRRRVAEIIDTEYNVVVLEEEPKPTKPELPEHKKLYRVRKSWLDGLSQVGAFKDLSSAIIKCKTAGPAYEVYDWNGKIVFQQEFEEGELVKIVGNAVYDTGKIVPAWIKKKYLFVRDIRNDGKVVVSTAKIGPITGAIDPQYLERLK